VVTRLTIRFPSTRLTGSSTGWCVPVDDAKTSRTGGRGACSVHPVNCSATVFISVIRPSLSLTMTRRRC
jgi:hypothetical protein